MSPQRKRKTKRESRQMPSPKEPVRTCTGCGSRRNKKDMIRIVADPSGSIIADLKGKLPGRGGYLCPDSGCVEKAAKGRLVTALRSDSLQDLSARKLREVLTGTLAKHALSMLGLAQKSGKIVSGTNLVTGELKRKAAARSLVIVADDASAETVRKIRSAADRSNAEIKEFQSREELGKATGKGLRSVLMVIDSGFAKVVAESINRFNAVMYKGGTEE